MTETIEGYEVTGARHPCRGGDGFVARWVEVEGHWLRFCPRAWPASGYSVTAHESLAEAEEIPPDPEGWKPGDPWHDPVEIEPQRRHRQEHGIVHEGLVVVSYHDHEPWTVSIIEDSSMHAQSDGRWSIVASGPCGAEVVVDTRRTTESGGPISTLGQARREAERLATTIGGRIVDYRFAVVLEGRTLVEPGAGWWSSTATRYAGKEPGHTGSVAG